MIYPIIPVPKPRMTRRDQWLKPPRPAVARYNAFKDHVRLCMSYHPRERLVLPSSGAHVTFHMPMPKRWPKTKRIAYAGRHHRQTPDLDNLLKALLDAVYPHNDSMVCDIRVTKVWAEDGGIEIRQTP
jgi:Holliday junction resolvase RusA-like endonuclease